jgi:hypothetical protein
VQARTRSHTHALSLSLFDFAAHIRYTTISLVGADAFFKTGDGAALAHTLVAAPGTTVWVDLSPPATDGAAAGTLLSSAATGTSAEETHHALSLLATNAEPTAPTPAPGLVWSSFPNHDAASGNDAFEVYGFAQSHTLKSLQQLAEEQGCVKHMRSLSPSRLFFFSSSVLSFSLARIELASFRLHCVARRPSVRRRASFSAHRLTHFSAHRYQVRRLRHGRWRCVL